MSNHCESGWLVMVYKTRSYCPVCGHDTHLDHFVIRSIQTVDSSEINMLLFELVPQTSENLMTRVKATYHSTQQSSSFFSRSIVVTSALDSPKKKPTDVIPNDSLGWILPQFNCGLMSPKCIQNILLQRV